MKKILKIGKNRNKARIWIEGQALASMGWNKGDQFVASFGSNGSQGEEHVRTADVVTELLVKADANRQAASNSPQTSEWSEGVAAGLLEAAGIISDVERITFSGMCYLVAKHHKDEGDVFSRYEDYGDAKRDFDDSLAGYDLVDLAVIIDSSD